MFDQSPCVEDSQRRHSGGTEMNDIPLPDNTDPRRTEVGNRIDPSLAKGFVKQMLKLAEQKLKVPKPQDLGDFKNSKARMRAIARLKKNYGTRLVAAVASKGYMQADFVLFDSRVSDGKYSSGIFTPRIDLTDPAKMPASHWTSYPIQSLGTCAFLTEHAMIRLAQRGGAKTFDDFLSLMKPFWAWASVAHEAAQAFQMDCHWFLPIPSGLFAVRTNRNVIDGEEFVVSEARTYIDCSDMRPSNQEIWDRLTGMGILDATPRFPRLSAPKQEQIAMMGAMISEGKKWYDRYKHAVQKDTEKETNPFG